MHANFASQFRVYRHSLLLLCLTFSTSSPSCVFSHFYVIFWCFPPSLNVSWRSGGFSCSPSLSHSLHILRHRKHSEVLRTLTHFSHQGQYFFTLYTQSIVLFPPTERATQCQQRHCLWVSVCLEKINFLGHHDVGTEDVMFKPSKAEHRYITVDFTELRWEVWTANLHWVSKSSSCSLFYLVTLVSAYSFVKSRALGNTDWIDLVFLKSCSQFNVLVRFPLSVPLHHPLIPRLPHTLRGMEILHACIYTDRIKSTPHSTMIGKDYSVNFKGHWH